MLIIDIKLKVSNINLSKFKMFYDYIDFGIKNGFTDGGTVKPILYSINFKKSIGYEKICIL